MFVCACVCVCVCVCVCMSLVPRLYCQFFQFFLSLSLSILLAVGSCKQLHVHDESLINTVGKFTCQPGKLYKSAMPKGIGKNVTYVHAHTLTHAHTHTHSLTRIHTHTLTCTHMLTRTHTLSHTLTRTLSHAHSHSHSL